MPFQRSFEKYVHLILFGSERLRESDVSVARNSRRDFYLVQAAVRLKLVEMKALQANLVPVCSGDRASKKIPPYLVGVYTLGPESVAAGARKMRANMQAMRECLDFGKFPGLSDDVEEIEMPRSAL